MLAPMPIGQFHPRSTTSTGATAMIRSITADIETKLIEGSDKWEEYRWVIRVVLLAEHSNIKSMKEIGITPFQAGYQLKGSLNGGDIISLDLDVYYSQWRCVHHELVTINERGSKLVMNEQTYLAVQTLYQPAPWNGQGG